jgi:hypothetical protein
MKAIFSIKKKKGEKSVSAPKEEGEEVRVDE